MSKGDMNGAIAKTLGGIAVFAAVIAAMYQFTQPISQRLNFQEQTIAAIKLETQRKLDHLEALLDRHANVVGHPGTLQQIATLNAKFTETETQFGAVRESTDLRFGRLDNAVNIFENWRFAHEARGREQAAAHDVRLLRLERQAECGTGELSR